MLYDEMSKMIFATSNRIAACSRPCWTRSDVHGGRPLVVEDVRRVPLSLDRVIAGMLSRCRGRWTAVTRRGEAVGVLLPNVSSVVVTIFALMISGVCRRC